MDAALQRIVGPAYRLERELPAGGMARVFVATEVALDRRVVIKVHTAGGGLDDARGQRFRREIQLAATLQHPAIVPLYAAGDGDGTLWYAMPFVEGASLRERLEEGALPAAEAVRLWRDLLEALAHAHERGVIHRDIKPENILLSGGRAVVTDFGVAKALDAAAREGSAGLTSVGIALGTPAYMAPEQALADPAADHRVDVYAAGLVAYEMLTGRMPFSGGSPQLLMAAHLTQPPPPLDGVAAPLAALVLRCLAKDAADRPATARATIEALDAVVTGSSPAVGARVAAAAPTPGATGTRRRRRGVLIAGAVLALVAAGAWALWSARTRMLGAPDLPGIALLAEVEHAVGDSAEARAVTEGLARTLIGVGELVVPEPASLRGMGAIFGFDTTARVEASRLREIVQRTGVRAVILPRVVRDGAGWVIDIAVRGGVPDTLILQERERVTDAASLALTAERLGRTTRQRLERLTDALRLPPNIGVGRTRSSEAATLLANGIAARNRGDRREAIAQLKAAVATDPWYAEAWRTLYMNALASDRALALDALDRAWAVRDSGGVVDRMMLEGVYWPARFGLDSITRGMAAYRNMIALVPAPGLSSGARNNLGALLADGREYLAAAAAFEGAAWVDPKGRQTNMTAHANRIVSLLRAQQTRDVDSLVALVDGWAVSASSRTARLAPLAARGDRARLRPLLDALLRDSGLSVNERVVQRRRLEQIARSEGRLAAAEQLAGVTDSEEPSAGAPQLRVARVARDMALLRGDLPAAVRLLDSLERSPEYAALDPRNRPYPLLAEAWLAAGDARRAQTVLDDRARALGATWPMLDELPVLRVQADLASARGDGAEALRLARRADRGACVVCGLPVLSRAWIAAGRPDSAIAVLERYVTLLEPSRLAVDQTELPRALRTLGELHEAAGHVPQAVARYRAFMQLWAGADASLQPAVREVQGRIARLLARKG